MVKTDKNPIFLFLCNLITICPGQKNTFENTVNECPLVKLDCFMRAFSNGSFSSVDKQAFDGYEICASRERGNSAIWRRLKAALVDFSLIFLFCG